MVRSKKHSEDTRTSKRRCTKRNREYILEHKKTRSCSHCGYNTVPEILHFHHTDPGNKKFALSRYKHRALNTLKMEIAKCILLCPNCHAIEHINTNRWDI